MCRKILIGGAWPYANGSLHIGHLAGLLPGDVLARYHRACGDDVYYVSGSDCHGTPVSIRAKAKRCSPQQISGRYHEEFRRCFEKLGFSYDVYGCTSQKEHKEFVEEFHRRLYESPYVYEKEVNQVYCEKCGCFLTDRYVEGICPVCGKEARGDQCDACGTVLDPENLVNPRCAVCGSTPVLRASKHLYLAVSRLQEQLEALLHSHPGWRKNAVSLTGRYLEEGLKDRALTRDLDWGIDVPRTGYENKKIYIWAENVLGYLSLSAVAAADRGTSFDDLWKEGSNVRHYYVHAKDNIPFHTIILPALLIAEGSGYHLPDEIVSNEYLTLEGRKISTSQNWAIWVKDIVDVYQPDAIRYFLLANGPEKRDTDFSWQEFVKSINGELLGTYGNFINRSLVFIQKYFGGRVPEGQLDPTILGELNILFGKTGRLIEKGRFKEALENIFDHVRRANKYFDAKAPWITRTENILSCRNTLYTCVQLCACFVALLAPFLPFSSEKASGWLGVDLSWQVKTVPAGRCLSEPEILFDRLER